MKAIEILKNGIAVMQEAINSDYGYWSIHYSKRIEEFKEAIEELEALKSCDGCKYKDEDDMMDYSCFECSRYYVDRYSKRISNGSK